jgi:hypothetical protein
MVSSFKEHAATVQAECASSQQKNMGKLLGMDLLWQAMVHY